MFASHSWNSLVNVQHWRGSRDGGVFPAVNNNEWRAGARCLCHSMRLGCSKISFFIFVIGEGPQSRVHSLPSASRGKSLLELWGTTFLPD